MGSIAFEKHVMEILDFKIQLIQLKELKQLQVMLYFQLKESLLPHPMATRFPEIKVGPPSLVAIIGRGL